MGHMYLYLYSSIPSTVFWKSSHPWIKSGLAEEDIDLNSWMAMLPSIGAGSGGKINFFLNRWEIRLS
jgi:hypothetical protein